MLVTSIPQAESARIAASLPEPGPFTITSTVFKPCTSAAFAAVSAAICAAYGVDFLEPLNPRPPALAHDRAFPCASVRVTIVLLKDAWICAWPCSTFLSLLTSSCWQLSSSGLFWFSHWSWSSDREPAVLFCDGFRDSIRFPAVS